MLCVTGEVLFLYVCVCMREKEKSDDTENNIYMFCYKDSFMKQFEGIIIAKNEIVSYYLSFLISSDFIQNIARARTRAHTHTHTHIYSK